MSITVIVRFEILAERVNAALEMLRDVQPVALEAGSHEMQLLQDPDDPTICVEIETWDTAEAHRAYVASLMEQPAFEQLMGWLAKPPTTQYLETRAESRRAPAS